MLPPLHIGGCDGYSLQSFNRKIVEIFEMGIPMTICIDLPANMPIISFKMLECPMFLQFVTCTFTFKLISFILYCNIV